MADYTIDIRARIEEAQRKVASLDKQLDHLQNKAEFKINFPNLEQVASGFRLVGKAIQLVWKYGDRLPVIGDRIGDIKDISDLLNNTLEQTVNTLKQIPRVLPTTVLSTGFSVAASSADKLARATANVGYTIFGLKQSIDIVRQAFNGFFNETIGRQARLEESLLRTRTTLVSTADVAVNGTRLTDPYKALMALEGPIDKTIENIRRRSLDIAGTTSDAIVQTFGVVASQIGNIGGDLKDAEDLAISFAGALGTMGLSNPMYATQEIRSILTGTIDQNSVLARALGLTNEEVQKAKTSGEGLVAFLEKRLEAFTAGQKIAAQQLGGVLSNIAEIYEEFARSFGKPILAPLLDAITQVYTRLGTVFDQILQIGEALGTLASNGLSTLTSIIGSSNFGKLGEVETASIFSKLREDLTAFVIEIDDMIQTRIYPVLTEVFNQIANAIGRLLPTIYELGKAFARFKLAQFEQFLRALGTIGRLLNATIIPAINSILVAYTDILNLPISQYLSSIAVQVKFLEKIGIGAIGRIALVLTSWRQTITAIIGFVKGAIKAVGDAFQGVLNGIGAGIKWIGENFEAVLVKISTTVVKTLAQIMTAVSTALNKIGLKLIELSAQAKATGTQIGEQVSTLLNIGGAGAFGLSRASGNTATKFADAIKDIPDMMSNISKTTDTASKKVSGLGVALRTSLAGGLRAASKALLGLLKSIALFSLKMAAVTIVIAVVVDAFSRLKRSMERTANIRRAETAAKRLSTTYKDLGENANAFNKALRENELEKLETGINDTKERINELIPKLDELARKVRTSTGRSYAMVSGAASRSLAYQKEIKELEQLQKQLQYLTDIQNQQTQNKQNKDTVQVLAKERKGVEEQIKKYREGVEKSLADYAFTVRQRVERLAQQEQQKRFQLEAQNLQQELTRAQEGLVGPAAEVARILGEYQTERLRNEQEAQNREFDLQQQIAQLGKDVADYSYELKKREADLQKKIGVFNQKVVDYEVQQKERAAKRVLAYEIRAQRMRMSGFALLPGQRDEFLNEGDRRGMSATKVMAAVYAGVIQPPAGASAKAVYDAAAESEVFRAAMSSGNFENHLNLRTKALFNQSRGGTFAMEAARSDLKTGGFYITEPKAPPPVPNLELNDAAWTQERERLNTSIIDQTRKLNATLEEVNKILASGILTQLERRSILTDRPTLTALEDSLASAQVELNATRAISGLALKSVDPLELAKAQLTARYDAAVRQAKRSAKATEELETAQKALKTNYDRLLKALPAEVAAQRELNMVNASTSLYQETGALRSTAAASMLARITEVSQAFTALGQNSEELLRRKNVEAQVEARRLALTTEHGKLNETLINSLANYRDALDFTTKAQLALEKKLKPLMQRAQLATELAGLVARAQKDLVGSLIAGGDIQAAMDQYLTTIAGSIFDSLMEASFKPIEKFLQESLLKAFGVENWEDQLLNIQQETKTEIETQGRNVVAAIETLPEKLKTLPPDPEAPEAPAGGSVPGTPSEPSTDSTWVTKFGENLTKLVGSLGVMAGGIAMGFAGVERMKKGGTYNTLMGLAGIFGGISSVAGGGSNVLKMFEKRATGGPVNANQPYFVGERGIELFAPDTNGTVYSAEDTRRFLNQGPTSNSAFNETRDVVTRQSATTSAVASPIDMSFSFQTTKFMDKEWVDTAQLNQMKAELLAAAGPRGLAAVESKASRDPVWRRRFL